MNELRAAILGAGGMGWTHADSLNRIDGVRLVCICDEVYEKAQTVLTDLHISANIYDNFDDMTSREEFDLLYICLPPYAHNGQFEKAAARGINIFIEKPIALDSSRGESMVAAAKAAGIKTHVGFHMRFGTAVRKLRAMIDCGETGRPVLFNGRYQCNALHAPWWRDVSLSGGQIFEQAIHLYDLCLHFFGNPQNTMGIKGNLCHAGIRTYTVEDVSASVTRFCSGAIAAITATNCSIPGKWDAFCDLTFEHVSVSFTNPDTALFNYILPDGSVSSENFCNPCNQKFAESEAFIDALRGGYAPPCPIEEGLRSLYFVEAVVRSASADGEKTTVKW